MDRILDFKTKKDGKNFKSYKYCFETVEVPKIEYDDKQGIHGLVKAKKLNDNSFLMQDGFLEYIIGQNDFLDISNLMCSNEVKDFLKKHYLISREDIKNPDSEIYREKEEYDRMKSKHYDIS